MQVYFCGAIAGGRSDVAVYRHIVERLQASGHLVPTTHVADPDVLARESAVPAPQVYQRDIDWIEQSDAVVAEVSTPSLGVGYEICYALHRGLPVLCLYRRGLFVSKMITGNPAPRLSIAEYASLEELDAHLDVFLDSLAARPPDA